MALTTQQIKENIQHLKNQGADQDIVDGYINQVGFSSEYFEQAKSIDDFEKSPLGKFLRKTDKTLEFIPQLLGFPKNETGMEALKKRYIRDLKGENLFLETVKDIAKSGGESGIAAAQIITSGIGSTAKALKGIEAGKQLLKYGSKQAAIQGGLGTGKRLMQGESLESAAKGGATEGGLNIASIVGLPVFQKIIKESGKSLLKFSSNVRNFAIDRAIKKPSILYQDQPSVIEVGDNILKTLSEYAEEAKAVYRSDWEKLPINEGLSVDVSKVRDVIKKNNIDKNKLSSRLKSELNRQLSPVSENAIDRFISGGNLSAEEAKNINSFLFEIVDTGIGEELGSGAIGKIGKIKKEYLDILDDQIPGLKEVNKKYAKATEFYQKVKNDISIKSGDLRENVLNVIGQRQTGLGTAGRSKTQQVARLKLLDDVMGTGNLEQLQDSLVAEEFERIGMTNLINQIRFGTSGGVGAYLGGIIGGPAGAITGTAIGTGATSLIGSPQATKSIIKAGTSLQKKAIRPLIRKAGRISKPMRAGLISAKGE